MQKPEKKTHDFNRGMIFQQSVLFFSILVSMCGRIIIKTMKRRDDRLTFTLQIDEEVDKAIKKLRDKHRVNISAVCRDAIVEKNKKLESK